MTAPSAGIRLHKIIAHSGTCSLREAERLIGQGRVKVNGKTVDTKGFAADPAKDVIKIDGVAIETKSTPVYLIMHKPKGYVTTRADEKGRKTVMDILPPRYRNLYPVGRLDITSEGLLIFTNDGDFAQTVMAPKNRVERVYRVKARNIPDKKTLKKMVTGVTIDGDKLKAKEVAIEEKTGPNVWLKVVLTEGKNKHIRRLLEPLGHPVLKLKRVSIGPVSLGGLKPGEVTHLPKEIVNKLMKVAGKRKKT